MKHERDVIRGDCTWSLRRAAVREFQSECAYAALGTSNKPCNRNAELSRDASRRRILSRRNDEQLRAQIAQIELELLGAIARVEWRRRGRLSDAVKSRRP